MDNHESFDEFWDELPDPEWITGRGNFTPIEIDEEEGGESPQEKNNEE